MFFYASVPNHFKHLTTSYVNICFIAQYIKIHDTYRFLLFVFLIFFSLNFLPTAHPLLKQTSNMNVFRWSERNPIKTNVLWHMLQIFFCVLACFTWQNAKCYCVVNTHSSLLNQLSCYILYKTNTYTAELVPGLLTMRFLGPAN